MLGDEWFVFLVFYLVAALVYFAYELITTKKWKNLLTALPGLGIVALLNVGILLGMHAVEKHIVAQRPAMQEIESVSFCSTDGTDYISGSSYLNYRDYINLMSRDIAITDPTAVTLVSYYLDENLKTWEEGGSNAYQSKYYTESDYSYCAYHVIIRTKDQTLCRLIYVPVSETEKLLDALQTNADYVDAWRNPPQELKGTAAFRDQVGSCYLSTEQAEELLQTYREELQSADFETLYQTMQNGSTDDTWVHPLTPFPAERKEPIRSLTDSRLTDKALLSSAALWYTFEAMSALNRPEEEADWQQFKSMKRIAWKTGTSYGGRDAWAIGTTPRYVVGVWAGNASGEGRPGLTGVGNAAPVLFDLFSLLPGGEWFDLPYDEMLPMAICRNSGHKASPYCEQTDTLYMPLSGNNTGICPYHKLVHLSADGRYRVNSSCESVDRMISRPWFVLPPAQEYYYRNYHIDYIPLPPVKPGCGQDLNRQIELIYPEHNAILYLPKGFSGKSEKFIFKAAHARRDATIYWHLDESYLGETTENHQISCSVSQGKHLLTLIDNEGNQKKIQFEVK